MFPPVDSTAFAPDPAARERARAKLGVEPGACLVGTVGVRNPQKGHETFVRAAARIAARHPDARFRVLGADSPSHGSHMRGVEAEARALGLSGKLDFVDPGEDVARLIQAFDVFVMSSVPRSEGMPTAILEAMACAKPVVATDVGATRELLADSVTGTLVPPLQPEAIADAVAALLDDPLLRRSMGEAALERSRSSFSLERLAAIHASAYEIAAARARSRAGGSGPAHSPATRR